MELWLLGAGAIVLIAITVWIVWWPSRPEDGALDDGTTDAGPETPAASQATATASASAPPPAAAVAPAMSEAATAPAGGVQIRPPLAPAAASAVEAWAAPTVPRADVALSASRPAGPRPPMPMLGAETPSQGPRVPTPALAVVLSIVSAVGGAWLYARWQRSRQKVHRPRAGQRLHR